MLFDKETAAKIALYVDEGYKYTIDGELDEGEEFPTFAGLAMFIKTPSSKIRKWAIEDVSGEPDYVVKAVECLDLMMDKKERNILAKGSRNELNSNILKMSLEKDHQYGSKINLEQSGKMEVKVDGASKIAGFLDELGIDFKK